MSFLACALIPRAQMALVTSFKASRCAAGIQTASTILVCSGDGGLEVSHDWACISSMVEVVTFACTRALIEHRAGAGATKARL